ncbi:MAG: hypothetical protein IJN50_01800 [Clostridia bacterium]|nr:hypothetical protein [Clostridia bacterium]
MSLQEELEQLIKVRKAKKWFDEAHERIDPEVYYLASAANIYDLYCAISVDDHRRADCKISIKNDLKKALEKASHCPELMQGVEVIQGFLNKMPTYAWSYGDDHYNGSKRVELVKTKQSFERLLKAGYEDITGDTENVNLCGIKVAYRREIRRYDSEETEKIKEIFKAKYPTAYDAYKMGFEVLYPDSEYHGVYKIYIPDVQ